MPSYDANEIVPNLWQGRAPYDHDLQGRFDLVVLAAKEHQPLLISVDVHRVALYDEKLSAREAQMALNASRVVAEAVQRGKSVLVTCAMGLNRSGLISALALIRMGMAPPEAILAVRRARSDFALHNASFVAFLNSVRPVSEPSGSAGPAR